jgi:hypothetical protein
MANLKDLAHDLRVVEAERPLSPAKIVEICFKTFELYVRIDKKHRTKGDEINCCLAATSLSRITHPGLAARVRIFLAQYKLPDRAEVVLEANYVHMEAGKSLNSL